MYKLIKLSFILLFVSAVVSCTKLQEEPFSDLTSDIYYQDKNSIIAAVTRPYEHGQWCGWDGDRWEISELTADQFVWTQKGKHGYDGGDWVRLHGHSWTPDDNHINGGWVGPYQGIAQCNILLNDMSKLDYSTYGLTEADKAQHISELRTLRA